MSEDKQSSSDYEKSSADAFKEFYYSHNTYLNAIGSGIFYLYGKRWDRQAIQMVSSLPLESEISHPSNKIKFNSKELINLRNCWYNECALHYPNGDDKKDDRVKFAAWKIVQAYYTTYCAISSIIRCFYSEETASHKKFSDKFTNDFLCCKERAPFFLSPINIYLEGDVLKSDFSTYLKQKYKEEKSFSFKRYYEPNINDCLKWTREKYYDDENKRRKNDNKEPRLVRISIFHYMWKLRELINYQESFLFSRLYGDAPKRDLDFSLQEIAFIFALQAEFLLIKVHGWDLYEKEYLFFMKQINTHLQINSQTLEARHKAFSAVKDRFEK